MKSRQETSQQVWYGENKEQGVGSVVHNVLKSCDKPSDSVIKKLCTSDNHTINEDKALSLYRNVHYDPDYFGEELTITNICVHNEFEVKDVGLVIDSEKHWLVASPDGLINCDCCGIGIVEIKCPYSLRETSLKEKIPKNDFYVKHANQKYFLDKSHNYYAQL